MGGGGGDSCELKWGLNWVGGIPVKEWKECGEQNVT